MMIVAKIDDKTMILAKVDENNDDFSENDDDLDENDNDFDEKRRSLRRF